MIFSSHDRGGDDGGKGGDGGEGGGGEGGSGGGGSGGEEGGSGGGWWKRRGVVEAEGVEAVEKKVEAGTANKYL